MLSAPTNATRPEGAVINLPANYNASPIYENKNDIQPEKENSSRKGNRKTIEDRQRAKKRCRRGNGIIKKS